MTTELCPKCDQRGVFGYRNKETGELTWYCATHRLGQYWADARRDIQTNNVQAFKDAAEFSQCDQSAAPREPFVHHCYCGTWAAFGYDVSLRAGKEGNWFCAVHRPDRGNSGDQ
jgi:hypothetical protein